MNGIRHITFPQLVDRCASDIMIALIAGKFRVGVYQALILMGEWQQMQVENKEK